jgi:hypothetical protein
MALQWERRSGCYLENVLQDSVIALPKPKSTHTLLPILTVLFLISYGLLTLLVVEQGRTIQSQRYLINELFSDSTQLSNMKGKEFQKQRAEAQAQADAKSHSQAQAPSSQGTGNAAKSDPKGKARKSSPLKPPKFANDVADERRALISI